MVAVIDLKGKGAYAYVLSYLEGANQNVIWPADSPERLAHAERIADVAEAAGLTYVLIKVADGIYPYNKRRKLDTGRIIFNSTLDVAVDPRTKEIWIKKDLLQRLPDGP